MKRYNTCIDYLHTCNVTTTYIFSVYVLKFIPLYVIIAISYHTDALYISRLSTTSRRAGAVAAAVAAAAAAVAAEVDRCKGC